MRARGGPDPVYRITAAQTPLSVDLRNRTRRYLWSMGVRTGCFLGAIIAHGALRWVLVGCALVLPWVSVIGANVGREADQGGPEPVSPAQPLAIGHPGAAPPAPGSPAGATADN